MRPTQAVLQQHDRVRPGVVWVESGHCHKRVTKGEMDQKEGDRVTHGQGLQRGGMSLDKRNMRYLQA